MEPDTGGTRHWLYQTLVVPDTGGTRHWWYLTLMVHVEDPLSAHGHLPGGPPLLLPEFPLRPLVTEHLHLAVGPATHQQQSVRYQTKLTDKIRLGQQIKSD